MHLQDSLPALVPRTKSHFVTATGLTHLLFSLLGCICTIWLLAQCIRLAQVTSHLRNELLWDFQDLTHAVFSVLIPAITFLGILSLLFLIASIGLLLRKNWSRYVFTLSSGGILLLLLLSFFLENQFFASLHYRLSEKGLLLMESVGTFRFFVFVLQSCSGVLILLACSTTLYSLYKLLSPETAKEFN